MPTKTGTTRKKNPTNVSATPRCGRRSHSATAKQHRRRLKDMKRSATGSRNHDVLSLLYAFTGHVPRSRLPADQAMRILGISQRLGQHLVQGNLPRTWIELKNLMEALEIDGPDTLVMQKHTAASKLFHTITRDERPEWSSLPVAALKFYAAFGVELRPVREQFDVNEGADPKAFDPEAELTLTGAQLAAGMAMVGTLGDEAFGK